METMGSMLSSLKNLAEAFLDKNRTEALIKAFDRIDPLLKNLNSMSIEVIKLSKQVTKDDNIGVMVGQLAVTTQELNKLLPEVSQKAPAMAKDIEALVHNMAILTGQFKVIIPALEEVAPDLPAASRRALEALDEAVVLMKAMEKSFFVKSNADEVRDLETEEIRSGKRKPATKH
jgi:phospholipid/cholesterol/gamma-HCH transport system substrate-binding protein